MHHATRKHTTQLILPPLTFFCISLYTTYYSIFQDTMSITWFLVNDTTFMIQSK